MTTENQQQNINSVMKDIAYFRKKADQLELNLIDVLLKENQMLTQQHQLALKRLGQLSGNDNKNDGKKPKNK